MVYLGINYLGVPLISLRLNVRDCSPLLSKLCGKIECWTSKSLCMACRTQLLATVLFGIQNYWSMYIFLPKGVTKKMHAVLTKIYLGRSSLSGPVNIKWHGSKPKGRVIWVLKTYLSGIKVLSCCIFGV